MIERFDRTFTQYSVSAPYQRGIAGANTVLLFLASIFFFADVSGASYVYIYFGAAEEASREILLATELLIIACFVIVAFFEQEYLILSVLIMLFAYLTASFLSYSFIADSPFKFNALGQYCGLFSFVIFYELRKRNLTSVALKILFFVSMAYLAIYIFFAILFEQGVIGTFQTERAYVNLSDLLRPHRIYLYAGPAVLTLTYSVSKLKERLQLTYLASGFLAILAIYYSQTRLLIVASGVTVLLFLITGSLKFVRYFAFIVFMAVSIYLSLGLFKIIDNPYSFSSDPTTVARKFMFDVVSPYILMYPIFGVGLDSSVDNYLSYTGNLVFPGDIAIIGIFFQFGIVGVVLLGLLPVYISCFQNQNRSLSAHAIDFVSMRTLTLSGSILALLSAGTTWLSGSVSVIFGVILANYLFMLKQRIGSVLIRQIPSHIARRRRRG